MSDLEKVKILIGVTGNDENALLELLLERAGEMIERMSTSPKDFDYLKVDAVVVAYNQQGAEGNKTTSSGGFSQSWSFDTMASYIKQNLPAQYVIK